MPSTNKVRVVSSRATRVCGAHTIDCSPAHDVRNRAEVCLASSEIRVSLKDGHELDLETERADRHLSEPIEVLRIDVVVIAVPRLRPRTRGCDLLNFFGARLARDDHPGCRLRLLEERQ